MPDYLWKGRTPSGTIENGEITIECHGWGDQDIPREYRNEKIKIRTT